MPTDKATDFDESAAIARPVVESPTATAPPAARPAAADDPAQDFQALDPRSIALTRLVNGIASSVMIVGAVIGGIFLLWLLPTPWKFVGVPLGWLVLGGVAAVNVVWWPRWEHCAWSYRLGEELLELRYGVVWNVAVLIPLSRLQHVDLHRGPLERRWGLASLQIHTAGTRDASHRIPGLDITIANKLRDNLIAAANRGSHVRKDP